jgi:hypothetical protein
MYVIRGDWPLYFGSGPLLGGLWGTNFGEALANHDECKRESAGEQ